jgi:CheY-like chemotaxis protein
MTEHRDGDPVDILLVEDNPGDVRLTEVAFEEGGINNTLHVVTDGEEALDFLFRRGEHRGAPRPNLVLLDLNLPKIDGFGVLERIRNDETIKRMPVIILTSSDEEQDIVESYELNSNAYLTKPVTAKDFIGLIAKFEELWFTIVRLPPKPE